MKKEVIKSLWKATIPIVIGLAVIVWLFHDDFSPEAFSAMRFDMHTVVGLILAVIFMVGRDFGLTWRFHTIADGQLSWGRALRVDLMCAFTSAITPSAVGGSALAIFYLNREKIPLGRATTLTLTTLFLDELFFVVFCPIIVMVLPLSDIFGSGAQSNAFLDGIEIVFWLVYTGIVIWTAILFFGIIVSPQAVHRLFTKIFSWRLLKRWLPAIQDMTGNMMETSAWVKQQGLRWWANIFFATVVSWFSRYLIVNSLFWAFIPGVSGLLVFARQFVVWVVLMVSPTPGGSGLSEWMFTEYYGDLIGSASIAVVLALIWRIVSYYVYLVVGVILLPSYFKSTSKSKADTKCPQMQLQ